MEKEKEKSVPLEEQLPHLPYYDRSTFYSVNWPELLADILLVVFGTLASHELFSKQGIFFQLNMWQTTVCYCLVVLTLPWYFGFLYVRNSIYFGKTVMRIQLWIFILITLMVLFYLVRLTFMLGWKEEENLSGSTGFIIAFSMFLLVLGPMMCMGGAATAYKEFGKNKSDGRFDPADVSITGVMGLLILAIGLMIWIIGQFPPDSGFGVVMLGYFGGPFLAVIAYGLFLGLLQLLDKIGIYRYLSLFAQRVFPLFIVTILVFWSGVAIYFMQLDFGNGYGKVSTGGLLFSVTISGLIPFRIISLFSAPWRWTNFLTGSISLLYFIWNLVTMT